MNQLINNWGFLDYLRYLPSIIIAIIIFYFSSQSNPLPPSEEPFSPVILFLDVNSILHVCEFGIFSFFVAFGFTKKFKTHYLIFFSIIYAISDEVHQHFIPNRYFDVYDVIVDIVGIFIGILTYMILMKVYNKVNNTENGQFRSSSTNTENL